MHYTLLWDNHYKQIDYMDATGHANAACAGSGKTVACAGNGAFAQAGNAITLAFKGFASR